MIENIRFDQGRHPRGKIGFVVLAMEQTVEDDVFAVTPPGVGVHFSRVPMSNQVTAETLAAMEPGIVDAAALLLPQGELTVLCYTCNSGTMVIGEQKVMDALNRANPGAAATTVMTGVVRALRALKARRLLVVTPYVDDVNVHVSRFLSERGFEIAALRGLGIADNSDIDRVEPEFIREYAQPGRFRGGRRGPGLRGHAHHGYCGRSGTGFGPAGHCQQPGHDVGLPAPVRSGR